VGGHGGSEVRYPARRGGRDEKIADSPIGRQALSFNKFALVDLNQAAFFIFKLAKRVREVMVAPVITVNPSGTILKSMARGRT
jgi:hypothetical protein